MDRNEVFFEESFPSSRHFTFDVGVLNRSRHRVVGFLEADVTEAIAKIHLKKERGEKKPGLFLAWFLKCLADAVKEHPHVHAFRKPHSKLLIFKEVDISILVEKEVKGKLVPLPTIIRNSSEKSLHLIQNEIENAISASSHQKEKFVISEQKNEYFIKLATIIPQFIRIFIWKLALRNPHRQKRMMGTVVVTSVGSKGQMGWVIPSSIHPLAVALGTITQKPVVIKDEIKIRSLLPITLLIDHDVIDGAPAARFGSRLLELLEKAEYL